MKAFFTAIMILTACTLLAQGNKRLNGYASYVFDDSFDSYYDVNANTGYQGKIKGGLQWGLGLEFSPQEYYGIELMYLRQDTEAPTDYYKNGWKHADIDLGINYIMLAGNRRMKAPGGNVEGFGGLMLGMCIASGKNPTENTDGSATKFAWGARLGANIFGKGNVGLKLQAQLLSAVQGAGGGFYFGTGGAGAGVSTYSSFYQFSLGGGIVFRLK
jgi:hypothetical protein